MKSKSAISFLIIGALFLGGCATSLGAQLGLHKAMPDQMVFDTIKSNHDQKIIDRYSAYGQNAATLIGWTGGNLSADKGGLLDELRKEMVARNQQWKPEYKDAVVHGRIAKGMDEKQVLSSWGTPTERQAAHIGGKYNLENWQYIAQVHQTSAQALGIKNSLSVAQGGVKFYGMITFNNGRVSSWQTFQ